MSGISSGVGIFSGIDTRGLIEQLLAIEARPKILAQQRIVELQTQQAAFLDINSALLSLKSASGAFNAKRIFRAAAATSSNAEAVAATAGSGALPGSYQLTVGRLVTTHQAITRGFVDSDTSGVGASGFSFEVGGGRIDRETALAELNGGDGVARGKISITDSSGATATIDLSRAVTVDDVLEAINSAAGISVSASVNGYGLQVTDEAGGAGNIVIDDLFGFSTATSLGIEGSAAAGGTISSGQLLSLSAASPLASLNDGAGVSFNSGGNTYAALSADFEIRLNATGPGAPTETFKIVLGEIEDADGEVTHTPAATIGDVISRIAEQTGGKVVASISGDGTRLVLTDTTAEANRDLQVIAGSSRSAAQDLGLVGPAAAGGQGAQTITGQRILAGLNSTLARSLNGGDGVSDGVFRVTRRDGSFFDVAITADDSIADVVGKINTGGAGTVTASLNDAGNGVRVTDSTTGGDLIIADTSGTAAADLNIATAGEADGVVESGNLQSRYVSGATLVSTLNGGQGIGLGEFRVTDSTGRVARVRITSAVRTVDDLLAQIRSAPNAQGLNVRINDQGDGILIEDIAGGSQKLKIEEASGTVAARLRIRGESADATPGSNVIDGSYEREVEFDSTDTLQEVADKINAASVGVNAAVVRSGSGAAPYKIIFTSRTTGQVGRFSIDTGGFDLGLSTLSRGEDAIAFLGAGDVANAVLLTSSTNTLDNVITGVTLDLKQTTEDPVEIVVSRDVAAIETTITEFVDAFNKVVERLAFHDRYDNETKQRGALLGDQTVGNVRVSLLRVVQGEPLNVEGEFTRLFQAGIRIGEGAQLEFDREKFRSVYEQDPQAIADLFAAFTIAPNEPTVVISDPVTGEPLVTTPNLGTTPTRLGIIERVEELANALTTTLDGTLTQRNRTLDTQIQFQERRIGAFDIQLGSKRAKLEAQFQAMERAIASLQSQQQVLGSIFGG